jgi:hypothetical protein
MISRAAGSHIQVEGQAISRARGREPGSMTSPYGVAARRLVHRPAGSAYDEEPADRVAGLARSDHCTHECAGHHEDEQGQARRADPIEGFERYDAGDQDERQPAQRPGQPCGGTAAHPTDFLPVLSQPHSTALPSPKRYDKRYEQDVSERFALLRHCGNVGIYSLPRSFQLGRS